MRFTREQIDRVKRLAAEQFGSAVRVRLFGSRTDDDARGGDVDLLVEVPTAVDQPALRSARLEALISRALHGRRVDVVLSAPNLSESSIHLIAREKGVPL